MVWLYHTKNPISNSTHATFFSSSSEPRHMQPYIYRRGKTFTFAISWFIYKRHYGSLLELEKINEKLTHMEERRWVAGSIDLVTVGTLGAIDIRLNRRWGLGQKEGGDWQKMRARREQIGEWCVANAWSADHTTTIFHKNRTWNFQNILLFLKPW